MAVEQDPLTLVHVRITPAGTVLHRTAPVQAVHFVWQGRLLQVAEVADSGVGRVVLGAGGDRVRCDVVDAN